MSDVLQIDGSEGEGGGQILRTALALSLVTGRPFEIANLRAGRKKPGLRPQHLTGLKAAAKICSADLEGARIGSRTVRFQPAAVRTGTYEFDIKTAGSTSLLLHTLYLPLALAANRTVLLLTGGTHVPFAPTFHCLDRQWAPLLRRIGMDVELELLRAGYYPEGGGQIRAKVRPTQRVQPLTLGPRGALDRLEGLSAVSNLDRSIAERQRRQALQRLQEAGLHPGIEVAELPSRGKGTVLHLLATFEGGGRACFDALGARGKRAERVADEACDDLLAFLTTGGALDAHAADQIILPLALADGPSEFPVPAVSGHLLTNARVIERFLDCEIAIDGARDAEGTVSVTPC
ncbi:MAG: RNA 3'-terminal phosphate cyclase [Planctomycetota bacterium]